MKQAEGRRRRMGVRPDDLARQALLLAASLFALYPVVFMTATAFKDADQYLVSKFSLPWPLSLAPFREAMRGGQFLVWMGNSALFTAGSVVLSMAVAILAAF